MRNMPIHLGHSPVICIIVYQLLGTIHKSFYTFVTDFTYSTHTLPKV